MINKWTEALQAENAKNLALHSRPLPDTFQQSPSALLFLNILAKRSMRDCFRDTLVEYMNKAPAQGMKTLTNLLTIKKDMLPPGAVDVLKVAVIFDRVLSADERQKAGRSVSLIDVNGLLSSMSWALTQFVSACEKHAVFDRVYQQGLKEWDAL
eukprot:9468162-Pyramimonas_sp.AAC.1